MTSALKPFITARERKLMREMRANGVRCADVAAEIGRPYASVIYHTRGVSLPPREPGAVRRQRMRAAERVNAWFARLNAVVQGAR